MTDIFFRGTDDLAHLDAAERVRYPSFCSNGVFHRYENLFVRYESSRIKKRAWKGTER